MKSYVQICVQPAPQRACARTPAPVPSPVGEHLNTPPSAYLLMHTLTVTFRHVITLRQTPSLLRQPQRNQSPGEATGRVPRVERDPWKVPSLTSQTLYFRSANPSACFLPHFIFFQCGKQTRPRAVLFFNQVGVGCWGGGAGGSLRAGGSETRHLEGCGRNQLNPDFLFH